MRVLILASTAAFLSANALAADLSPPVLRGALPTSEAAIDWSGFYVGGLGAFSNGVNNTRNSSGINPALQQIVAGSAIEQSIRQQPLTETGRNQDGVVGFGGFVGYNMNYEDVIFGVEVDYQRARVRGGNEGFGSGQTSPIPFGAGTRTESWSASTKASFEVKDFGTVRGRLGYAWGNFLPYITGGLAWARAKNESSATISGTFTNFDANGFPVQNGTLSFNPSSFREGASTKIHFGYALGAGTEFALSSNIFLRAELQHIRIANIGGANVSINTVRGGAAVKF